jgi:hypothetical protein
MTIQPSSYAMSPSTLWAITTRRMLPPVWLKSHVYQNVTAIVVTRPATTTDTTKPPPSMKKRGRCHKATSGARIAVARSGE